MKEQNILYRFYLADSKENRSWNDSINQNRTIKQKTLYDRNYFVISNAKPIWEIFKERKENNHGKEE